MSEAVETLVKFCNDYYLAGIVDGEGCINIYFTTRKNKRDYHLSLAISNTNEDLIMFLYFKYKGHVIKIRRPRDNTKDLFTIRWFGNEAKEILRIIEDKVIVKKNQVKLALEFPLNKKGESIYFSIDENKRREVIYTKIKELNK